MHYFSISKSIGIFDGIKQEPITQMKRFFTILIIIYAFLFGFGSPAGAITASKTAVTNEKLSSLNSLKDVQLHLMTNGNIVRLEFKKPVSYWMKPVFYENFVEIDFRGAFIESFSKSFIVESSIISKVLASQSDRETFRVRFQTKLDLKYSQNRIKMLQQGRFIIIRFNVSSKDPSLIYSAKVSPEKKQKDNFISTNDDLLSQFLPSSPKKNNEIKEEKLSKLNVSADSPTVTPKEPLLPGKEGKNSIEHMGRGNVGLVDQIKKWIFILGILFLVIFCFKKYFLKNTPRVRGRNGKKISPDDSEISRSKTRLIVFKFLRVFFSSLRRISQPKEANSVEAARKNVLKKIQKLQKLSR